VGLGWAGDLVGGHTRGWLGGGLGGWLGGGCLGEELGVMGRAGTGAGLGECGSRLARRFIIQRGSCVPRLLPLPKTCTSQAPLFCTGLKKMKKGTWQLRHSIQTTVMKPFTVCQSDF